MRLVKGGRALLRDVAADCRHRPEASLLFALVFGAAAIVYGTWRVALELVTEAEPVLASRTQVIAYLRDDLSRSARDRLRAALKRLPEVESVRFSAPEEALERLRGELGDKGRLLDGIEEGFLPPSLEVTVGPSARGATAGEQASVARQLAWRLRRIDGIAEADVIEPVERAERRTWPRVARGAASAIAVVAVVGLLVGFIFATATIRSRRRGDSELRLRLGFTKSRVVLPPTITAVVAALIGIAGGLLTVALGVRGLAGGAFAQRFGLEPRLWRPTPMSLSELTLVIGSAVVLGALLGFLSARAVDPIDRASGGRG